MGMDVDDSHRIYLRPFSSIEVPAGAQPRPVIDVPGEPAEEEAALDARGLLGKDRKATRRRPSAGQRGYVAALQRMERSLSDAFEKRVKGFFETLGRAARAAAADLIDADAPVARRGEIRSERGRVGKGWVSTGRT